MNLLINIGISIGVILVLLSVIILLLMKIYKVAEVDKALIITGGKKPPRIIISGGAFIIPVFRKFSYFDLCMLTVKTGGDVIGTKTAIPIIIDWTAQIRPDTRDVEVLRNAIVSFKERGSNGIIADVKETIMGAVRAVVANLTPEEVRKDQETFKQNIRENVLDELKAMGLELVSLNIQDIRDDQGYFDDIAAIDREEKRREAEKIKAIADQEIREQAALSEKSAKERELATELQIAEIAKENDLKKAQFKIETDKANADAIIAGELQRTIRLQEVAEQEGKVEVVKREQANLAAQKEKEVTKTKAEAEKIQAEIKAQEEASVATINANAKAKVLEAEASGRAIAIQKDAEAKAKAIELDTKANTDKIKKEGEAEAEIISKKGKAEAEKEKAILLAKAEGEKALAEARSGNDKVNFEIEKLKIEWDAKVQIATNQTKIMADFGKNAEFVNIGNSNTGNAMFDSVTKIPGLLKSLDAQGNALNDMSGKEVISELVSAIVDPIKGLGLLSSTTPATVKPNEIDSNLIDE